MGNMTLEEALLLLPGYSLNELRELTPNQLEELISLQGDELANLLPDSQGRTYEEAAIILLAEFSPDELLVLTPDQIEELISLDGDELTYLLPDSENGAYADYLMAGIMARITRPYDSTTDNVEVLGGGEPCPIIVYDSDDDLE